MANPNITGIPFTDWGSWLGYPWYEVVASAGGRDDGAFGMGTVSETLTIRVNWSDEKNVIAKILGYATSDTAPRVIQWNIPVSHPRYSWLYATKIVSVRHLVPSFGVNIETELAADAAMGAATIKVDSVDGFIPGDPIFIGDDTDPVEGAVIVTVGTAGAGGTGLVIDHSLLQDHSDGADVVAYNSIVGSGPADGKRVIAQYTESELTILFQSLPYNVLTDVQLTSEFGTQPVTTFSSDCSIGSTTIGVTSATGIVAGMLLSLSEGTANQEYVTVVSPGATTTITTATVFAHTAGDDIFGIQDESNRFCEISGVEGAEYIYRQAGQFRWAEGNGSGDSTFGYQPLKGSPLLFSLGSLLIKPTLQITWNRVPLSYLMDANLVPVNVRACEGKVNSVTFMGRKPGTLLFLEPKIEPIEESVDPTILALQSYQQPRSFKVMMGLKEFNPPSGLGTYFGHNLAPNPGSSSDSTKFTDLKWYLPTTTNDPNGTRQYQQIDFKLAFAGVLS